MKSNIINRLAVKCRNINSDKVNKELYDEIINSILNINCDEENKINLLVEVYRFGYYSDVRTSLDSRGDRNFKFSALAKVRDSLLQNNIDEELIENMKKVNNYMRLFIDNPVKFIEEEIEFSNKHPNARF